jgi:hypothetical protein
MTSVLPSRWHLALRIGVFSALAALGVAACHTVEYLYPKNLQAFVLPPACPIGSAPADTTQLRACLTGIEFDTTEFVGDEQRLMVRDSGGTGLPCFGDSTHTCRYGPLARVDPVKGAEMYSNAAMAQGRIIARMYLRANETESYPKFALAPVDTTYWWVKIGPNKSVFVRRTSGVAALADTVRGLTRTPHPPGSFQQSFAQWVWDPVDETLNGACGSHCCRP